MWLMISWFSSSSCSSCSMRFCSTEIWLCRETRTRSPAAPGASGAPSAWGPAPEAWCDPALPRGRRNRGPTGTVALARQGEKLQITTRRRRTAVHLRRWHPHSLAPGSQRRHLACLSSLNRRHCAHKEGTPAPWERGASHQQRVPRIPESEQRAVRPPCRVPSFLLGYHCFQLWVSRKAASWEALGLGRRGCPAARGAHLSPEDR